MTKLIRCQGRDFKLEPKNGKNFTKDEIQEILGITDFATLKISRFRVLLYNDDKIVINHKNEKAMKELEAAGIDMTITGDAVLCKSTQIYW